VQIDVGNLASKCIYIYKYLVPSSDCICVFIVPNYGKLAGVRP